MKSFLLLPFFLGMLLTLFAGKASAQGLNSGSWPVFHANTQNTGLGTSPDSSGYLKWAFNDGLYVLNSVVIDSNGTIYLPSMGNKLRALNPDGSQKWSFSTGSAMSGAPAIGSDGTVYAACYDSNLYALNSNGTLKWVFASPESSGFTSQVALAPDGTIYASDYYAVYAINPDGPLKWQRTDIGQGYGYETCAAIGSDGTVYITGWDGNLYSVNPADGSIHWYFASASGSILGSSPAIGADGTIYFGDDGSGNFYAINPDGSQKWVYNSGGGIDSSPAIGADGTIYFGNETNSFDALNPDGSLKWSATLDAGMDSSPALSANGLIYFGDSNGLIYALNPDGTRNWTYQTGSGIAEVSPAIGPDGTVYIGSPDHYLYAFGTAVSTISVNPLTILGGNTVMGTVTLNGNAPAGGITVNLASDNPAASVPSTVIVPAGSNSATFTIATSVISASVTANISATAGGITQSTPLGVETLTFKALRISPTSVPGGAGSTGGVSINGPAPVGGVVIALSSDSAFATVPSSVTIPEGSKSTLFPITTSGVSSDSTATFSGTLLSITLQNTLTVKAPVLYGVTVSQSSVVGGKSDVGKVSMVGLAPSGGIAVSLSSDSGFASVPPTVTIPAGSTTAYFTITTSPVAADSQAHISATWNSATFAAPITVSAPVLTAIRVSPTTVVAGATTNGAVSISSPAPEGGLAVSLSSDSDFASVPPTVTIPQGATSVLFTISTSEVSSDSVATFTASLNGDSMQSQLTVRAIILGALRINPTSVTGGASPYGAVSINLPAPAGGVTINLASDSGFATPPTTVTIPEGATSVLFTLSTQAVSGSETANLTATLGNVTKTATLTVNH